MTQSSISQSSYKSHPKSYAPHLGWLSHGFNEELITLIHRGYFEAAEQAFFWLYLRPGDCFIDCGAHIGLYSVLAYQATKQELELVAIEADPKTFEFLKKNLDCTVKKSTKLINAAVWSHSGKIGFVDAGRGKSAYSHVSFDTMTANLPEIPTITLDHIVSIISSFEVSLIKIDVEGAEPEVLSGGEKAIREKRCPLLMIEFTEANLARRSANSIQLAKQLKELGYELCEFSAATLELFPVQVDGPIWYKNLFACIDHTKINKRLSTTCSENKQIALDILERAKACALHAELENLRHYKELASTAIKTRGWAEHTEQLLAKERLISAEMRQWAEHTEQLLAKERLISAEMRQWAEHTEQLLAKERLISAEMRQRTEHTEQLLAEERITSLKLSTQSEHTEHLPTLLK